MAFDRRQMVEIAAWHKAGHGTVVVGVRGVRGSTPRDGDAAMAVTAGAIAGTIGGGRLEWLAIARARRMLAGAEASGVADIALGPEIGQCCGGRVSLSFDRLDDARLADLVAQSEEAERRLATVVVFGAGHTGRALATALAPLPLRAMLVDSRPEAFDGPAIPVKTVVAALPEQVVRQAPAGTAFVVMTHDHSIDFLIAAEALRRGDAAYVGMIGSATKRAVFLGWLEENGYGRAAGDRLVCPIGGSAVRDKRPAVIAALTAAEILEAATH